MPTNPLPPFYVGKQLTQERVAAYLNNKHNVLSQSLGKQDTKSIWYSKQHLQGILNEIESIGGDGLRIQLGMYEQGHEFEGQLCLLMNSTKSNGQENHIDVFLEDQPDFTERSALPRSGPNFGGKDILTDKDFNFGTPCPPRCP